MPSLPEDVLTDYVEFETYLLCGLEKLLASPLETPQGHRLLTVLLDLLLDTFPRELGLKNGEGYLDDVLRERPHLALEVEQLRRDHAALWRTLQSLRSSSTEELSTSARRELRDELSAWRETLLAKRHHELRLVQEAGCLDIGGEA